MYEVICVDLKTNKSFTKIFWSKREFDKFRNKCRYSQNIMLLGYINNEKYYD